ncbi:MAG: geranyl-CoA carboxylase alpha subunit, partial [bacterium]
TVLFGITHNQQFLLDVLQTDPFIEGQATTSFLKNYHFSKPESILPLALGSVLSHHQKAVSSSYQQYTGWNSSLNQESDYKWEFEDKTYSVTISPTQKNAYSVKIEDQLFSFYILKQEGTKITFLLDGIQETAQFLQNENQVYLSFQGGSSTLVDQTYQVKEQDAQAEGKLQALMDGKISKISVKAGDEVKAGQTLLILEAMKMEHPICTQKDGVIKSVLVQAGEQVKSRQLLIELESE